MNLLISLVVFTLSEFTLHFPRLHTSHQDSCI